MEKSPILKYSPYQQAIFDAIPTKDNIMIEAVAGSGKTTTIVDCLKLLHPMDRVLFLAFNKSIVEDLVKRVPPGVEVKTFHGLGFAAIRNACDVTMNNNYRRDVIKANCGKDYMKIYATANTVISLHKATLATVDEILDSYNLDVPKGFEKDLVDIVEECCQVRDVIDFDDMLYRPVMQNYEFPEYDQVFVDEAQDLSPIQVMMLKQLGSPRFVCVGDRHQGIYAFRGANTNAIPELVDALNCKCMPLSISYRCPSVVVEEARKLVPHIEYHREGGKVSYDPYPEYVDTDLVLCRTTMPLVKECLRLLRKGQRAHVVGKDEDLLYAWREVQAKGWDCKKYLRGYKKLQWEDLLDTLQVLRNYDPDIKKAIRDVFAGHSGVTLMTVHRSKGLEADRVFILRPDLLPHPQATDLQQERNLHYVAITRAKREVIYVQDPELALKSSNDADRIRESYWSEQVSSVVCGDTGDDIPY